MSKDIHSQRILILDFGSQYTQLIARRVRELNIYCEIHPYNNLPKELEKFKAVILSGSPSSVRSEEAPHPDLSEIRGKKPLLAVCYGAQYIAHTLGGNVSKSEHREYCKAMLTSNGTDYSIFRGINSERELKFICMQIAIYILTRSV